LCNLQEARNLEAKRTKSKSKTKKNLSIIGIILGVIILAGGGYAYYLYHSVSETANKMYSPLKGKNSKDLPLNKENTAPSINVLLLGVDERSGDKGRSDTMIVASLNPTTHSMLMTSIPRDTRVEIPGRSGYSKINAAYAYGNEELALETVEKYLNIDIPYYVKVNMEGLSSLVDAVGGVSVNNDISWTGFPKGTLNLDGKKALAYARMRHEDPRGDFGRNLRQRQVITGVMEKGKSLSSVSNMENILNAVGGNVTTNLSFDDMKRLVSDYKSCRENITDYETKGTPKYLDGVSWVLVTDQEFQNVHNKIETQLNAK
ncbi:MAG TPA: LCP family protein, partial [Bacillales bacterium]|nr:LCP family protein [Bacillales bacterium]